MVLPRLEVLIGIYPRYISVGQSQDSFPIRPVDEEAIRLDDGGDVGSQRGVGAVGHGHQVGAQLALPPALGVRDVHALSLVVVGAGAGDRGSCCFKDKRERVWKQCGGDLCCSQRAVVVSA